MKPAARKKLIIVLGGLVLLAFIATLLIPKLLDPDRYHDQIVSELEKALGGKVRIGDISWGLLKGLWLEVDGVEITGASAFPLDFKLSRVYADVSILPLLKKKIVLNRLLLESPDVQLRPQPGPQEAHQEGKVPASGAKQAGIALPLEIEDLLVTKGRVRIEDGLTLPGKPIRRDFDEIEIKARNLAPGREMLFDISLKDNALQGVGVFKAQGAFAGLTDSFSLQNPKLTVRATLSGFHTEALKPFLGNDPWVQRLSGSLSAEVNYKGDLISRHRLEGSIDLSRLAYTDPSLWEAAIPGAETKISFRADLQADDLTVEKLEVKVGKFSFRAKGDVVDLKKRPLIKNAAFSADVPLLDSVPLFPWKVLKGDSAAFVRSIFEGGGKVEIEQAVLPSIDLAAPPATEVALLNGIESISRISGVSVELSPGIPRIKNIDIDVRLAQGIAQVQVLSSQFTTVDLPSVSGKVSKLFEAPLIDVTVKGPVQVSNQPPEDLTAFFRRCGLERVNGSADLDAAVVVDTSQPADFQVRGRIGLRRIHAKASFSPAQIEGLRADLTITPEVADITNLSASVTVPAAISSPGGRFDLQLEGRVDQWSRRPSVTLHRLKTSSLALPVVASLVPWEKLGDPAEPIKQTFLNGGTLTIDEIALPKVELYNLPKSPAPMLSGAKVAAAFAGIVIEPYPSLPVFEDVKGRVKIEKGVLTATGVQGRMGPLSLPDLNIRVSHMDARPKVAVRAKGPVQLAATSDEKIEDFLKRYGLKSLVVAADVDVRADFNEALQDSWAADASLALGTVRAESYPEGAVLEDLQGKLTVNRKKGTTITAENIRGQVNQAPVRLSGKILGIGTPNLLIDVKAGARQLDLAQLRELSPSLKKLDLRGTVDMDLDVYIPYATARNSRLSGMLSTRNLTFKAAHLTVEKGDAELNLSGNTALIKRVQVQINDTLLEVTGQVANSTEPDIQLHVTSPDLTLDRLLPSARAEASVEKPSQGLSPRAPEKTAKTELSPTVLKTTARIRVEADKGRYKGIEFQKLTMDAFYDRGEIKQADLSFGMEGGHIAMTGSGDTRDPEDIRFRVSPNIKSLSLERIAAILGVPGVSVSGPVSANGELQGRAGISNDLLASLTGNLDAEIGPGEIARIGRAGEWMARLLSLTSIKGILSGSLLEDFANKGLPYQRIIGQATFNNGNMDVTHFRFDSNAMNLDAQGRVNLLEGHMDIGARLKPLGEVSTVMGAVPLVGKVGASLTEIYFNVTGSLDDPQISIAPGQGVADAVQDQARGVGSVLKGATDSPGKEENKWIWK